ncbi:PREDICTED: uncharacterized protein At5g39865-like [Ipomoea nil]|uniref:uncharacterized protein At5g39865-like n=1 Tax=Ipomoea nil TaxID=35883 RepID=UPI0009008AEA|nr:PREDICTED: uncharacterized protein At5g39865-like [Ipomoea nil]
MGCVSSTLLSRDEEFAQIGGSAGLGHHIVSLTSTTYGLLTLDPPAPAPASSSDEEEEEEKKSSSSPPVCTTAPVTPIPPTRFSLGSLFASPLLSEPRPLKLSEPPSEVINSWELMSGLDSAQQASNSAAQSFRFAALPSSNSTADYTFRFSQPLFKNENSNPNLSSGEVLKPPSLIEAVLAKKSSNSKHTSLDAFQELCPPNGETRVVIYTTTLRGVRKTFEACNAVRSVIEGAGVLLCERDISMDKGFKEELRELMKEKDSSELIPPRVFVKGRYIGGAEELLRIAEEGGLGDLLQGLPKLRAGYVCEGCGGARFLPCFTCNGSCKMVMAVREDMEEKHGRTVVVRCSHCNENGLVLCPICT